MVELGLGADGTVHSPCTAPATFFGVRLKSNSHRERAELHLQLSALTMLATYLGLRVMHVAE